MNTKMLQVGDIVRLKKGSSTARALGCVAPNKAADGHTATVIATHYDEGESRVLVEHALGGFYVWESGEIVLVKRVKKEQENAIKESNT